MAFDWNQALDTVGTAASSYFESQAPASAPTSSTPSSTGSGTAPVGVPLAGASAPTKTNYMPWIVGGGVLILAIVAYRVLR